jgi:hypothetical protein
MSSNLGMKLAGLIEYLFSSIMASMYIIFITSTVSLIASSIIYVIFVGLYSIATHVFEIDYTIDYLDTFTKIFYVILVFMASYAVPVIIRIFSS